MPASRRLSAHRWIVAMAPGSRPTVRVFVALPVHDVHSAALRVDVGRAQRQGLADAPGPVKDRDQGPVADPGLGGGRSGGDERVGLGLR